MLMTMKSIVLERGIRNVDVAPGERVRGSVR
jgi:hypothetical protein